jgi:hypothetical protein
LLCGRGRSMRGRTPVNRKASKLVGDAIYRQRPRVRGRLSPPSATGLRVFLRRASLHSDALLVSFPKVSSCAHLTMGFGRILRIYLAIQTTMFLATDRASVPEPW